MDKLLYIAMNGANAALRGQAINANNLANASTPGFRADFAAMVSSELHGAGLASRAYSRLAGYGADLAAGPVQRTGRDLDVAINGQGWIAVQAADGSEAYTRRGDLQVNTLGQLLTGDGLPVLGNGGPIAIPPFSKLDIGADGTISILPEGQNAATLSEVDRIRLVNPIAGEMIKGADGLMHTTAGISPAPDASVRLIAGALENSNVNTVDAMVRMIELARSFETQVKMMRIAADNDRASAELMGQG